MDAVLRRRVRSGVWRRGSAACRPAGAPAADDRRARTLALPPSPGLRRPADAHAEDESIDNYMERLLKRVRGESATDTGPWKQISLPRGFTRHGPRPFRSQLPSAAVAEPEGDYLPRTTAPEETLGLSAMRDLANTAARTAIETHIRKHTGRQAVGKLVTATLIIATSSVLDSGPGESTRWPPVSGWASGRLPAAGRWPRSAAS